MQKAGRLFALVLIIVLSLAGTSWGVQKVVVGCDADFKPFTFKDEDGKMTGFEVDLWAMIAKDLNLTYEIRTLAFEDLIPALLEKKIDVALAGMTISSGRERVIDFSFPYFKSGLRVMVRADEARIGDLGDLDDKVVATKHATTAAKFVKNIQTQEAKYFRTIDEAYDALLNNKADAVVFDEPNLFYFVNYESNQKAKIVGRTYQTQAYGIALQPASPLREPVTITLLKFIEDGQFYILFRQWFGYVPH